MATSEAECAKANPMVTRASNTCTTYLQRGAEGRWSQARKREMITSKPKCQIHQHGSEPDALCQEGQEGLPPTGTAREVQIWTVVSGCTAYQGWNAQRRRCGSSEEAVMSTMQPSRPQPERREEVRRDEEGGGGYTTASCGWGWDFNIPCGYKGRAQGSSPHSASLGVAARGGGCFRRLQSSHNPHTGDEEAVSQGELLTLGLVTS